MSISIVIPNYNGKELLEKNLPRVFDTVSQYRDGEIEIIVIDDCSKDDSLTEIQNAKVESQNYGLKFRSIRSEYNLGFSSTVNRGVKEAKGEIVVLLNTDVAPERSFLTSLLPHFRDNKVFAVGCMDKSIENSKVILRGRGIGRWERGFFVHSRGEVDKTNTLWVSGGSGAFRKSIWKELGGFDELYNPFYWEDIDLSYRALKSGYQILFEPKSVVLHEHEKGAIKKQYSPFRVKTIAYRNQFIFSWKNATDLNLQFAYLFWLPYHFIKALAGFDLAFFKGFFSAFVLLPKIIEYSIKERKFFLKKDKEVVSEFIR